VKRDVDIKCRPQGLLVSDQSNYEIVAEGAEYSLASGRNNIDVVATLEKKVLYKVQSVRECKKAVFLVPEA
jgi:hypothetical protein